MCGIFGIINYEVASIYNIQIDAVKELTANLLSASQVRGLDASGICMVTQKYNAHILKHYITGKMLVNLPTYNTIMKKISSKENFKFMIGHTRHKTKGTQLNNINNHPIVADRVIGVHNGVINNDDHLFNIEELHRAGEVDSEVIFRLIDVFVKDNHELIEAVRKTARALTGSFSCAFIHTYHPEYVTLFTGPQANIALHDFRDQKIMIFASTSHIIDRATEGMTTFKYPTSKLELASNAGIRINSKNGKIYKFDTI